MSAGLSKHQDFSNEEELLLRTLHDYTLHKLEWTTKIQGKPSVQTMRAHIFLYLNILSLGSEEMPLPLPDLKMMEQEKIKNIAESLTSKMRKLGWGLSSDTLAWPYAEVITPEGKHIFIQQG